MARILKPEEINEHLQERSNGRFTYIPDEKFPYENCRSTVCYYDNELKKYSVGRYDVLCWIKSNKIKK